MIDWKRKLTSRKFWAAVIGVVASVLAYCGANESTVTQVTAIITAGATLVAYIVGEGLVDAAYKPAVTQTEPQTEPIRSIGFAAENCDTENGEKDNDPRD